MTDKLWTIKDVAKHYRVCERTVRRMRHRGRIPEPVVSTRGTVRWRPADFYIREGKPGGILSADNSGQ